MLISTLLRAGIVGHRENIGTVVSACSPSSGADRVLRQASANVLSNIVAIDLALVQRPTAR